MYKATDYYENRAKYTYEEDQEIESILNQINKYGELRPEEIKMLRVKDRKLYKIALDKYNKAKTYEIRQKKKEKYPYFEFGIYGGIILIGISFIIALFAGKNAIDIILIGFILLILGFIAEIFIERGEIWD